MSNDKMREEFEAWWRREYENTLYCENAWRGWKASRAALEVVSLSDYEAMKSEHDALKHAVGRLMEHDFAEDCQECGIGQSDAWAEVKTIIAGAGVRVKT